MEMSIPTLVTFIAYLIGMLVIGTVSYKLTKNLSDYMLGGRRLGPGVTALSAGASDMSGWLLLGLPGAFYAAGMNQIWIAVGLAMGAYLNWQFVARRFRVYTEVAKDSITVSDYFENRFHDSSNLLRVISAMVVLLFFTFYTSAGMVGGATLFEESFGMSYQTALWVGAIVIVSYTFFGGFLAVSWTDFFQGILMFLALVSVPVIVVQSLDGWNETVQAVGSIDPDKLNALHGMTFLGIISLMAWGLGYFGQPHIIIRFMALKRPGDMPKARLIGIVWMTFALLGAIFTGFAGIAYFADQPLENSEAVFINLSQVLFNPWIAGILLAAILSAIMSTIDSQLLVSASALTEDFYKTLLRKDASEKELVWVGRSTVAGVALIAIFIAMDPQAGVLDLVGYGWSGFGAAFGPIIILSLFWRRMTRNGALAGMIVGAGTVIIWRQLEGGLFNIFEILPGFILATIAIIVVTLLENGPGKAVEEEFDSVEGRIKRPTDTRG